MDARLTAEQRMLDEVAARFAVDLAGHEVADPGAWTDRDARGWADLSATGLIGLHTPASVGGGDAGVVETALVAERFAAALSAAPFLAASWSTASLAAAGADAALRAVNEGGLRLAPVLRPDLSGPALRGEDGIAVDARGARAGLLTDADGALHAVALGPPTRGADLTRTLCPVAADAAEIDLGVPLGSPLAPADLIRVEATALAVLSADLLGTMRRALDDAVAHVARREQFGVPVGSFQAVQHLAAHAATRTEGSRGAMWHAAWAATRLAPDDALLAARQAKAYCAESALEVAETAVQLLGGIALTREHPGHLRLRRVLLSRALLGDENAQYAAIAARRLAPSGTG
ncbi:alkylation response protein AidB-like acyl-CoA dehydrogenase [Actinocorallia herbida]|uniref:Alkylation response protein AidB-like acyl-CoA dehydrogenase n=1 Tax=Actinocorallia herbida TaxID=58109 RepID=A0A3N1CVQ2_9ACTN|nr:acyl-CoA dehydrogenase [Actinocorallia herbida]ROO85383.1 alkylation response protein AidB-like acyl-CoA dehydrogenase [Actinocorallia herbida]